MDISCLTKHQEFYQVLDENFEKKLWIPTDFVKHASKEEESRTAILNGPSGNRWFVRLSATANGLYFKDGWETFLRDHSLKFNDLLVFTYLGGMHFRVKIFREKTCEWVDAFTVNSSQGLVEGRKCQSAREDNVTSSSKLTRKGKAGESAFSFTSHFPHFLCEMKATHVQKLFNLTVPTKFAKSYLPRKQTTMVLQDDDGDTWDVKLTIRGPPFKHTLCTGWKSFSDDKNLKLGDYCVFELVEVSKMIVHIYRSQLDMRNQGALVGTGPGVADECCNEGDICLTSATNTTNSFDKLISFTKTFQ